MTNRVDPDHKNDTISNVKGCFEKFEGENIVSVKRNGLTLSILRELY